MADFPVSNSIVSIVSFEKPAGVTDGDTVAHINKINKEIDVNGHITSGSICQKKTTSKFPVHQNSSSVSFNKDDFISGTVVGVAIRSTSVQIGDDYSSNAGKSSPKINPNSRSSLNEKMIEANTFAEVPEPPKRRASFWKDIGIDDKSNKEILSLADNDQAVNNIGLEQERPWAGQSPAINANQLNSQFQKDTSRSSMQSSSYIYTVLKTILERTLKQLRESSPVCFIVRQSEKPKVRIIAALILLLLVPVGGVLAIISLATHKILPYIWIYNLVIVLLVLLVIVSPILLEKLFFEVTNACIASNMIQGLATLTDVTQNSLYRKIPYGKSYRVIAWWTEAGFIGVVFWLCISANWTPIDSFVTNGKCITPIYPDIVNIPNDLGDYLQGDTEFAVIYNYALPLYDGVVGGWAAWPLIAPAKKFSLSNPNSLMYASSVVCEDPELSNLNHTVTGTRLWYSNSITWNGMFTSMANIVYPANSHSISKWKDRDILQRCEIKIFSFSGSITFSFVVDEWDMVTGGQITSLTAQSGVLAATQGESASQYFDQYESRIPMSDKSSWKNITRAMSIGFETVFNGTEYNSTQGASFCNLMQWATLPDGLYYTNITWKGVAAAIGSISHYVAMQYESNAVATCSYYALGSAGFMSVNEDARTATYVLSGTLASLALFYVIWWYFTNIDGWTVDKAFQCLRSPLNLAFFFRESFMEVMGGEKATDLSNRVLRLKYEKTKIQFGESKHTRAAPVGRLLLATNKNIVKLIEGRSYA